MKYYSETLKKLFDSERQLKQAEVRFNDAEAKKKELENLRKAKRAEKAKEVERALKEANEAQAKAIKLLKDFTKEYGYFHTSYQETKEDADSNVKDFFDVLNAFLY